jgi:hypothetical protein
MKKPKYLFKASTFNQFKLRYTIFATFFGTLLIILFLIRGISLDIFGKFSIGNYYQIMSFFLIIFYVIVSVFIYQFFKKEYLH